MKNQMLNNTQRNQLAKIIKSRFDVKINEMEKNQNKEEEKFKEELVKTHKTTKPLLPKVKKLNELKEQLSKLLDEIDEALGKKFDLYNGDYSSNKASINVNRYNNVPEEYTEFKKEQNNKINQAKDKKENLVAEIWGISASFEEVMEMMNKELNNL